MSTVTSYVKTVISHKKENVTLYQNKAKVSDDTKLKCFGPCMGKAGLTQAAVIELVANQNIKVMPELKKGQLKVGSAAAVEHHALVNRALQPA